MQSQDFLYFENYIFNPNVELADERAFYEGLLSEGDLAIWLGREKHRKTNLLLQFAICSALGLDFLQFKFKSKEPLRVVIVDYESKSNSLKKRYDALCTAMGLTADQCALLKKNLRIIEVRKIIKEGGYFPHLPVNPTKEAGKQAQMWAAFCMWPTHFAPMFDQMFDQMKKPPLRWL